MILSRRFSIRLILNYGDTWLIANLYDKIMIHRFALRLKIKKNRREMFTGLQLEA